jgi:hypothetical protein
MSEMFSPQYFFVNKVSGPSYDQNNYYDIILTCKPDPSCVSITTQGFSISVAPPPNSNDTYYKITNPVPGQNVIVTLQPYSGTDYSLYCSETPGLFPFPGGTKPYVHYSNNGGKGEQETCSFIVPRTGTYYYLVHHVRGGYGYTVEWDYGSSSTICTTPTTQGSSGGCLKEGTKVLTPEGLKKIEDLNVGNSVIGYKDGKKVETKVLAKMTHSGTWTIYYYKGSWFTGNHRVYPSLNDEAVEVETLSSVSKSYTGNVYDIKTGTENYFGENDLLIHNKGGGGGMAHPLSIISTNITTIIVALMAIVIIFYGILQFFVKKK